MALSVISCSVGSVLSCRSRVFASAASVSLSLRVAFWNQFKMEEQHNADEQRKKRTFRKVTYRGLELDQLLDLNQKQLSSLLGSRVRRRLDRGLKRKQQQLLKKLKNAKKKVVAPEKPEPVKTHLRNMPILPEMVGSIIGVYNGKIFNQVEVKTDMIGHYLAEFSMTYKAVKHGRPGIGATHSSRFIPLK